jgi:Lrp/AsnC family transcriptional regulator for asnA, asnC and gidA
MYYTVSDSIMVDEIDRQLLVELRENAHQNSSMLARKLHLSPATVRRRVNKMLAKGVIRIVARLDSAAAGLNLAVIIGLDVEHDKIKEIQQAMLKRRRVRWVSTSTGRYRIIVFARFTDMEDLQKFITDEISDINGIKDIETHILFSMKGATTMPSTF